MFWERFAAEYLAKLKPATHRGYESCFANYLGPALGAYRLDSIDRAAYREPNQNPVSLDQAALEVCVGRRPYLSEMAPSQPEVWLQSLPNRPVRPQNPCPLGEPPRRHSLAWMSTRTQSQRAQKRSALIRSPL